MRLIMKEFKGVEIVKDGDARIDFTIKSINVPRAKLTRRKCRTDAMYADGGCYVISGELLSEIVVMMTARKLLAEKKNEK